MSLYLCVEIKKKISVSLYLCVEIKSISLMANLSHQKFHFTANVGFQKNVRVDSASSL